MAAKSPFCKRLKQIRTSRGFSQKKLGIAAGIDEFSASPRMNQYETGKHEPDYLTIAQICKVLKVDPAFMHTQDDTLAEIIQIYSGLNIKDQKKMLEYVKKNLT